MDEGPQGPGTNGLKSGTVLAIQVLLRPMLPGKRESHDISPEFIAGFVTCLYDGKDMCCATERLHTVSPQYFSISMCNL